LCKRCEKLNVDHLGECPFKQEDWEAEFGKLFDDMQSADAPDVQTIIKDFIKPLLSTQEEKIRKEETEKFINIYDKAIETIFWTFSENGKSRAYPGIFQQDVLIKLRKELLNNL